MSPAAGRRYPLTVICEVWRVPRSTVYAVRERAETVERPESKKRGPKTKLTDAELVEEIRAVLKESDFLGEGHRKVRARLRPRGINVGKNRVLRLMRENGLQAPVRRGKYPRGDRSHSGRITTDVPNELWGTDATRFYTKEECLYLHDFRSLEEARHVIGAFIERYNRGWLLERHGYKTPAQVRRELTPMAA